MLEITPNYNIHSKQWHKIFATDKHAKIHHLATLFDNTNAVSNPEKGDQLVRIYEILPNYK